MNEMLVVQIKEIIEIAETCPDLYKVSCFKVLLEHQLNGSIDKPPKTEKNDLSESENIEEKTSREIKDSDLDYRFKKFMEKYTITLDKLNQLFYFEDGVFLEMYDNLKTLKAAEFQIRVALLQAMKNAMSNGNFEFDGEAVRAECQMRKVHDAKNFAANFKNNARLFAGFDAYKKGISIKLCDLGKEELAKVIEDISI